MELGDRRVIIFEGRYSNWKGIWGSFWWVVNIMLFNVSVVYEFIGGISLRKIY